MSKHPELELVVTFGMHKGKPLSDVPCDYLKWLLQTTLNKELKRTLHMFEDEIYAGANDMAETGTELLLRDLV